MKFNFFQEHAPEGKGSRNNVQHPFGDVAKSIGQARESVRKARRGQGHVCWEGGLRWGEGWQQGLAGEMSKRKEREGRKREERKRSRSQAKEVEAWRKEDERIVLDGDESSLQ